MLFKIRIVILLAVDRRKNEMKSKMTNKIFRFAAAALCAGCMINTPVYAAEAEGSSSDPYLSGMEIKDSKVKNEKSFASSAVIRTGVTQKNGKTVYISQTGEKLSGEVTTKDGTYSFDENGELQTGFVTEQDATYYYNKETGLRQEGGVVIEEGKKYLLDETGKTQTGWVEEEGKKYYLNEDGSAVLNTTKEIDGKRYSFNESGEMEINVTKAGWTYGEDGVGQEDLSGYDKIAQAALAQLGRYQDCTMLVTNSLAAVGINFHSGPTGYLSLGPATNNPVPGDIIVYSGHVAIYIGNGQAVHGGWLGSNTVIASVSCGQPLIAYVHPILP